jgi:hypothetical protein
MRMEIELLEDSICMYFDIFLLDIHEKEIIELQDDYNSYTFPL